MESPNRFKRVCTGLPVEHLVDQVAEQPSLWKLITTRQDYEGSAHHDTECIFLRWCRDQSLAAAWTALDAVWLPTVDALSGMHAPLLALLQALRPNGDPLELGRVILVNLPAGGVIDEHLDEGAYAEHYDRFHISLQSDEGNRFWVDGESFHALPGEAWWFNHRRKHSVRNDSATDRLHLIVDAAVPAYRAMRGGA